VGNLQFPSNVGQAPTLSDQVAHPATDGGQLRQQAPHALHEFGHFQGAGGVLTGAAGHGPPGAKEGVPRREREVAPAQATRTELLPLAHAVRDQVLDTRLQVRLEAAAAPLVVPGESEEVRDRAGQGGGQGLLLEVFHVGRLQAGAVSQTGNQATNLLSVEVNEIFRSRRVAVSFDQAEQVTG
jgi:hypothetical protein